MAITDSISVALSGLNAAQRRFENSATNVANVQSVAVENADSPTTDAEGRTLFQTRQSVDTSVEGGGVRSSQPLANPVSVQQFDPDAPDANADGLVNRPNVTFEREAVEQISASAQFQANLATIRTADELFESTLDILS